MTVGMHLSSGHEQWLEVNHSPDGWDVALDPELTPWPLAPKYLVDRGEVNDANYSFWNERIGQQGARAVIHSIVGKRLMVFGVGLAREWDFLPELNQRNVSVSACDWSMVACQNGNKRFAQVPAMPEVENRMHQVDIECLFDPEHEKTPEELAALADLEEAETVYAGQLLQVLGLHGLEVVIKGGVSWLRRRRGRTIRALHACAEHGNNRNLHWGHSTPYSLKDDINHFARGANTYIYEIGGYYEYIYSTLIMTADE